MKEIQENRERQKLLGPVSASGSLNKAAQNKEKIEQNNIKKAWINIVKRDIPKAYR